MNNNSYQFEMTYYFVSIALNVMCVYYTDYSLYFPVAAVADEDGSARGEDHAEDNHDGEEDEGA